MGTIRFDNRTFHAGTRELLGISAVCLVLTGIVGCGAPAGGDPEPADDTAAVTDSSVPDTDEWGQGKEDDAEIVTVVFPETLDCGATTDATVVVRNLGTATWTRDDGYKLGTVGDEDPFYPQTTRVWLEPDETVEPGDDHTFTFELVAPDQEDVYITDWQMVHEHVQWFGETVSHDIVVSCPEQEEEAEWEYTEAIEDQVLASATWVRENFPDYFDLESIDSTTKRTIAYEMMTTVINDLRGNGVDSSRCVADASRPESDPFHWCSDALVVGPAGIGVTIDIYYSWSYPADPQTSVTGTASTGVVTSDLVDVSG
jgi:hypothetical protein